MYFLSEVLSIKVLVLRVTVLVKIPSHGVITVFDMIGAEKALIVFSALKSIVRKTSKNKWGNGNFLSFMYITILKC